MNPQLMTNPPIKQQAPNLGIRSFMNLFLKTLQNFFIRVSSFRIDRSKYIL
jgi:hypothetical protein